MSVPSSPSSYLRRGILAALATAPLMIFGDPSPSSAAPLSGEPLRKLFRRGVRVRMRDLRPGDVFVSVEPGCRPQAFRAAGWPDLFAEFRAEPCAITCEVLP